MVARAGEEAAELLVLNHKEGRERPAVRGSFSKFTPLLPKFLRRKFGRLFFGKTRNRVLSSWWYLFEFCLPQCHESRFFVHTQASLFPFHLFIIRSDVPASRHFESFL